MQNPTHFQKWKSLLLIPLIVLLLGFIWGSSFILMKKDFEKIVNPLFYFMNNVKLISVDNSLSNDIVVKH
jgi:hypothetical protein